MPPAAESAVALAGRAISVIDTGLPLVGRHLEFAYGYRPFDGHLVLPLLIRIMRQVVLGKAHKKFARRYHNHLWTILGAFPEWGISRLEGALGLGSEDVRSNLL